MAVAITPSTIFGLPDYTYYKGDSLKDYVKTMASFLRQACDWIGQDEAKVAMFVKHIVQIETELQRVLFEEKNIVTAMVEPMDMSDLKAKLTCEIGTQQIHVNDG